MHKNILTFLPLALLPAILIVSTSPARSDDAPRQILHMDFATDDPAQIIASGEVAGVILTTDPAEEAGGKKSLKGDSRQSQTEWNEFFHSKTGLFQPKEAYKVSFGYKVIARDYNARFYALFRRAGGGGKDAGWTEWEDKPGQSGHVEMIFAAQGVDDGILIIGIQHKGAMAINNIAITTDPAHRPVIADLPAPRRTWYSPGNTSYYADANGGADAADGRSPKRAWRSLNRINVGVFGPGDHIYLKAGSQWSGFLAPGGSGAAGNPITVGSYGAGPKPAIDAAGKFLATVYLKNGEYWDIGALNIANRAPARIAHLTGVQVEEENFGTAHAIRLHDLDVHDVMGSNVKSDGGGSGIDCSSSGVQVKTRYDGLLIENCRLARTDRNGITMGAYYPRPEWPLSTHVVIRGNLLEDIGGDGIVPIGCDGCVIAHNALHGGRMRAKDYAAGIWPWSCDNTVVEYNEVSGMKGTRDGEGYDSDYNCRNTLFQYNFSHDNDGGFMLICDDGSQGMPWNIGNSGTIIRNNLSVNDGLHTFNITGPCQNTQITNNVFYLGKNLDIPIVNAGNWGSAWPSDTRFINNVFYVDGKGHFDLGSMSGTTFDHNAYWGDMVNRPADPNAILSDPKLVAPGSKDPRGYWPLPGSPLRRAGKSIAGNGGLDFWGNSLPPGDPLNIGAGQVNSGP